MGDDMSRRQFLAAAGALSLGAAGAVGIPVPSPAPTLPGQLVLWEGEVQDGYPVLNGRQDTRWRVAEHLHLLVYVG